MIVLMTAMHLVYAISFSNVKFQSIRNTLYHFTKK